MNQSKVIKAYTGTEVTVLMLKEALKDNKIWSIIQNDYSNGNIAGFQGGAYSAVDLLIKAKDLEQVQAIIKNLDLN